MDKHAVQSEIIEELLDAVYPSFALLAGLELGLFSKLQDGARDSAQLAETLGVQNKKLRPLLYVLVGP